MAVRHGFPSIVLFVTLGAGLTGCDSVELPLPAEVLEEVTVMEGLTTESEAAEEPVEPVKHEEAVSHDVHWTYEGEEGPDHWGALSSEYVACGGAHQSPIDITGAAEQDLANIAFSYQPSDISISNNGHTVTVDYDPGSYIEIDGVQFALRQFHFHVPSEHSIDGTLAAGELHLVHDRTTAEGELERAVVGVLIQEGAANPAFGAVWANLPPAVAPPHIVDGQAIAADMLPEDQTTFRYPGSLTTPPCDTNVLWNVMTTPIEMSAAQIDAFSAVFDGMANNRPVQPLGDRVLVQDATP